MTETAAGTERAAPRGQQPSAGYTAFISYAREDAAFARLLETAIETHQSVKAGAPLTVFRDEADFTGGEYTSALKKHLEQSASLIVVCSPNARRSTFVGDEIERFAALHGSQRIFPVLVDGLPDNEADDKKSFPSALHTVVGGMPLAADYRGFDAARHRFTDPRFEAEWFKLLANLQDANPAEIRASDKQRQVRELRKGRFRLIGLAVAMVSIAVVMALLWGRARAAEARERQTSEDAQTILSTKDRRLEELEAQLQAISTGVAAQPAPAAGQSPPAPKPASPAPQPVPPPGPPPPSLAPASSSPTTNQPAPAPTVQSDLPRRVYFHIRDQSQRADAVQLQNRLRQSGYVVPGIQTLAVGPSASELRYFLPDDQADAQAIARVLAIPGLVVKRIAGYEHSPDIRPHHFELWLTPSAY
jgi:hypothetical protein